MLQERDSSDETKDEQTKQAICPRGHCKRARADSSIVQLARAIECRAHGTLSNIIIAIMQVHRNLHARFRSSLLSRSHVRAGGARMVVAAEKSAAAAAVAARSNRGKPVNKRNLIGSCFYFHPPSSANLCSLLARHLPLSFALLLFLLSLSLAALSPPTSGDLFIRDARQIASLLFDVCIQ